MSIRIHFFMAVLLCTLSCSGLENSRPPDGITYLPDPLPTNVALKFMPEIIDTDSVEFGSAFSPEGSTFYFARSENGRSKIYEMSHDGKQWTKPEKLSFQNPDYSYADPAFSPEGILFFISDQPQDKNDTLRDYDIWYVEPNGDTWSMPKNMVQINSDSSEFYISFTEGGDLYFSSSRAGGYGKEDIYMCSKTGKQYTPPVNLGRAINSPLSEYDPFISIQGDFLIFSSSGRDDSYGGSDLYLSSFNDSGTWSPARNLGSLINTKTREFCPYIPKNSSYFFFSSEGGIKWINVNENMDY